MRKFVRSFLFVLVLVLLCGNLTVPVLGDVGDYVLRESEPNDTPGQADRISNDYTINGAAKHGDDDYFRFTLTQSTRIRIVGASESLALIYAVHDSTGTTAVLKANYVGRDGVVVQYALEGSLDPGTYYLVVTNYSSYVGTYALYTNFSASGGGGGSHTHNYGYSQVVVAPTCTEEGYTRYSCSCGMSYVSGRVPATGHDWDQGVVTKVPVIPLDGEILYTCKSCAQQRREVLHYHFYTEQVITPDCVSEGLTIYSCSCGDSFEADQVPVIPHRYEKGICVVCSAKDPDAPPKDVWEVEPNSKEDSLMMIDDRVIVHGVVPSVEEYDTFLFSLEKDRKVTVEVTAKYDSILCAFFVPGEVGGSFSSMQCTEPFEGGFQGIHTMELKAGIYEIMLLDLHRQENAYTFRLRFEAPEGHEHSHLQVVTQPTCIAEGFTTFTCECGDTYVGESVSALGHHWNGGETVQQATESTAGRMLYACTVCGWRRTEPIPATGHIHTFSEAVTEPGCETVGFTIYTCVCGDSCTADEVPALGHDFTEGTCTRCGEADPDYTEPVENPFADVPAGIWYEASVLWAVDKGVTSGTGNGNFSPDGICTRGQVVTFLWRAMGEPEPKISLNPFSDVMETDYYYKAVLWAVEKGITSGTGDGKFSPGKPCTRDQVVTFLWRTMDSPKPEKTENPFTDVAQGAYYYEPVLWAVENEITSGTSATTFAPGNPCTRAQVVTFLYRALNS